MKLIECFLYGFVDYSGTGKKSSDVLTGDQELRVRTAINGPEIDHSQHAKSVSHIIIMFMLMLTPVHILFLIALLQV